MTNNVDPENAVMRNIVTLALATLVVIGAPVAAQQRTSGASAAARAEARAEADRHAKHDKNQHCAAMEKQMGTAPMHDHGEMKGSQAMSPMNRDHAECWRTKKSKLVK